MSMFLHDLRYGFRTLMRSPGFTLAAILALALGIGANTAIFSVVQGVLLHSLPYENDSELVMLWEDATPRGGTNRVAAAPGNFIDWREANPSFTDLAALRNESLRLTSLDEPLVPLTHFVTANYFDLLGVEPYLGRAFRPEEDRPGSDRVVIVSYGLWQRVLGGDPDVLGTPIVLDGESYTIIGVLRPDYLSIHQFAVQPDLWTPLALQGSENDRRDRRIVVYGRLKEGVSLSEAQAAMSSVARGLEADHPDTNAGWGIRVVSIRDEAVGRVRPTLLVLLAAVGFVLLIACANVANLTLARAAERLREVALRRALGASSWRLTRQLVTESVVLAGLGGLSGLMLAAWGLPPLLQLIPAGAAVPFLNEVRLDSNVLAFTLGVSLLTGIVFGLVPAHQASRTNLNDPLKQGGRSATTGHGTERFGNLLVVAEVSLALVLMAGAGLMIQSFRNLRGYEAGFDSDRLVHVRNSLRGEEFSEPHQRIQHFQGLADRMAALPGVEAVSAVSFPPPLPRFQAASFRIPGEPVEPGHEPTGAVQVILPDFFRTMGIPVLQGRTLAREDLADSTPVAVINEALAERHFSDHNPVGQTLVVVSSAQREVSASPIERRIVGVVGNVRSAGIDPEPYPLIYVPHTQVPLPIMSFILRAQGNPESLMKPAERMAWEVKGDINVYSVETIQQRSARFDWTSEVATMLLGAFAVLALVLGAAGIYAVISYRVAEQTHEIGVRMALGAARVSVLRQVLSRGLRLTAIGIAVGLSLSLALAKLIASFLYGVGTNDFATFGLVSLLLVGVAVVACLIPALRASRVDPMLALRHE
jgi:putative ABC transport system permease protein